MVIQDGPYCLYGLYSDSVKIDDKIKMGAKYLFVRDSASYKEAGVIPFLDNKIGSYENIDIYEQQVRTMLSPLLTKATHTNKRT